MPTTELKNKINQQLKTAMLAKDKPAVGTLRLILAAIKQSEIDKRVALDDVGVLSILEGMVKQRKESIEQFKAGNREDLVEKEQFELSLIQSYMPEPLAEAEVEKIIQEVIGQENPAGMQDMGKVMNALKEKFQGQADMAAVSQKVRSLLQAQS